MAYKAHVYNPAKTGESIECCCCGKSFIKTNKNRILCPECSGLNTSQKAKKMQGEQKPKKQRKKQPPGTVNCTHSIRKKCTYSLGQEASMICGYILKTGCRRGCSWHECDKFKAIGKQKKRSIDLMDKFGDAVKK